MKSTCALSHGMGLCRDTPHPLYALCIVRNTRRSFHQQNKLKVGSRVVAVYRNPVYYTPTDVLSLSTLSREALNLKILNKNYLIIYVIITS